MTDQVKIDLTLEEKQAIRALQRFTKSADTTSKKVKKDVKAMSGAWASFKGNLGAMAMAKGFSLIGAGARGLFNTLREGVAASQVQEDAINQLNIALKASGQYTEKASLDFQKFASSLQEQSKYGDEAILNNAALIQSLGHLSQDGLEKATQAALDMSAALGIDLTAAATLVGKAAAGEVGSFSRYGLIIKKGATNAETFSKALTELNKKFGGAAAGQINTYSGASTQLSNSFGDLQEKMGDIITKNPAILSGIKELNKFVNSMGTALQENKAEIIKFVNSGLVVFIKGAATAAVATLSFLEKIRELSSAIDSIVDTGGIDGMRDQLAALDKQMYKAVSDGATAEMKNSIMKKMELAQELIDQEQANFDERQNKRNLELDAEKEALENLKNIIKTGKENITKVLLKEESKKTKGMESIQKKSSEKTVKITEEEEKKKLAIRAQHFSAAGGLLNALSALSATQGKKTFGLTKALALAAIPINTAAAVMQALATLPPPASWMQATAAGVMGATQLIKVSSMKPPSFQGGGIIGGTPSSKDNQLIGAAGGEIMLNQEQQVDLFNNLGGNQSNQPIVVEIDGREIARAVRDQVQGGYVLA